MDNQEKNTSIIIEYGKERLKDILNDILINYIGEKYAR